MENGSFTNGDVIKLLISIILSGFIGYIALLVRSIRKEVFLKVSSICAVCKKQVESCSEKFTKDEANIADLLVRSRILGTLETRLNQGAETFSDMKKRLDNIELKLYGKGGA
jgi:hypothetical protein